MKSFKTRLNESAGTSFQKMIPLAVYLTGVRKQKFINALETFSAAMEAKSIHNSEMKDHYSYGLTTGLDAIWEAIVNKSHLDIKAKVGDQFTAYWDLIFTPGVNSLAKFTRSWAPYVKDFPDVKEFLDATATLQNDVKVLKTYVVSGRPPAPPQKTATGFSKPMSPVAATQQAKAVMSQAAVEVEAKYRADLEETARKDHGRLRVVKNIADYKALPKDLMKLASNSQIATYVKSLDKFTVVSGAEITINRMIDQQVKQAVEGFIEKNVSKLELIFAKKSGVTEHKVLNTRVSQGAIENTQTFKFDDGSSFTLYSQVVIKRNYNGTVFWQFPTRFTNVKLANGSEMSKPSEERMIKEF